MKKPIQDHRLIEGLHCFNQGEYFECHEIIEDLWLETPGEDPHRDLYKGLIQAAAAIYQWDREIYTGALGLYRTSMQYLEAYKPVTLGIQVGQLIQDMKNGFAPLDAEKNKNKIVRPKTFTPVIQYSELH